MTTGLENKQEAALRLEVCPASMDIPWEGFGLVSVSLWGVEFTKQQWEHVKFLHWEWLKRNPEVECSCR